MRQRIRPTTTGAIQLVLVACLLGSATCAAAAENHEAFLDALRERGYYDMALEFLLQVRNDPRAPDDLKGRLEYEEGVTLIAAAAAERDFDLKMRNLDAARDKLAQFVKSSADSPLAPGAESQLGNILVERAKTLLQKAQQPRHAAQKDALLQQSRALFAEAQQVFASAEPKFAEQLKRIPKGADKQSESRREASTELRRARLAAAQATYESAKAYPADSAESKKLLESAAGRFGELHDKYRSSVFGILARAYQGRCYLDLGDTKRALGYFGEVLAQADQPDELRRLKAHALRLALQAWTSDAEKKYEEAAAKGQQWLEKARADEARTADGVAVRYFTALALRRSAEALPKQDAARRKQLLSDARKLAKSASTASGEYQAAAKQMYQELVGATEDDGDKPPATFAEAIQRGRDALDVATARQSQIRLAAAQNDQQNVPTYEREAGAARETARAMFRLALALRDGETSIEDVNTVRYYLCYLDFQEGNYYDAAVLGEFLARRYPTSAAARQSAKIALLAFQQAYHAAAEDDRRLEKQKMLDIADFITKRWAGEAEADEAWTTLMVLATGEHDAEQVVAYLQKIPADSPRRGEAELKAGQALWIASLHAARQPDGDRPSQEQLDKMRREAQAIFEQGLQRTRKTMAAGGGVSFTIAAAALSLSQIYVELDQADKAVQLLEDPELGPLTLVVANNPLTQEGAFATEAYKAGLRAYVASGALDKAEKAMNQLEALVAARGNAGESQGLIAIYRALGQELESQVAVLRQENRTAELEKVSRGFELFLDRIAKREQGNSFNSLNWVAETFSRLGSGYQAEGTALSPAARGYFEKSAATDEKILQAIAADPSFASAEAGLGVKMRLAKSLRRSGRFKQAVDMLVDVLREKPMILDVQKEAAYTFQEWGAEKPAYYKLAIAGARRAKDDKGQEYNIVWGWNRMAVLTQRNPKYQDAFHEARYNLAKCSLLEGLALGGAERATALAKAEGDVLLTARLHPDLGGGDWPKKYDRLLRTIQKAAGRPVTGLAPARSGEDVGKARADTAVVK